MTLSGAVAPGAPARRRTAAAALLLGLLLAGLNADLLLGRSVPAYRDLGTTQRPSRALFATLGPASVNPHASFGQPYLGNPNLLLAYPFPTGPRFLGLHLLLHAALAALGAGLLLARLVRAPEAALLGGIAFGLSGYAVSSTAFLNAATTIAWIPWLLLSVHAARSRAGRRLLLPFLGTALSGALLAAGGEPALGLIGVALAAALAATAPRGARVRSLGVLCGGGLVAAIVLSPWIVEVLRASAFSSRRLRGFSWGEFAAVGFHPLRFLETPFPLLLGDPTRFLAGGFWGYAFTQGNPPYLASMAFGVVPLGLALLLALSARRSDGRLWLVAAALSLAVALSPWLPLTRRAYEAVPALHALRYPGKAMLAFTLAVAALAALGADRLLYGDVLPRFRRRASWGLLIGAGLLAAAAVAGRLAPELPYRLLLAGWDPAWASDPRAVLGPVAARLPLQAAAAAALLLLLARLLPRGIGEGWGRLVPPLVVAAELLAAHRTLLPRVPASWVTAPSQFVARAASIPGRLFERTGKDLDPVRRGVLGTTTSRDLSTLFSAQLAQGWALTGAPFGLRYAWDADPDGSYSLLDRMARDVVVSRDWPRRLKWLRAAGVGSVIAHDVPPGLPGLVPLGVEGRYGVEATLYRLADPLPGVRRCSRVLGASSVTEAVAAFERDDVDPATDAVVAGGPPDGTSATARDASAAASVVTEAADALTIETSGAVPALLHVDRTFTPRVTATVDGRPARVHAVDVNLTGVAVPAGRSRVVLELAP